MMKIFKKRAAKQAQEAQKINELVTASIEAIQEANEVSHRGDALASAFIEERETNHFRERLLKTLTGEHRQ